MEMLISGFLDENKKISVQFNDGERSADGILPEGHIIKNKGFTEEELLKLEEYLKANENEIREEASKVNPIKALMK